MAKLLFDPGAFTARLTLERAVESGDSQGGAGTSHTAVGDAWARIEPVSATRRTQAGAEPMVATHRIWLRHRGDLTSGMRLRKGARIFAIRTFRDPDETGRYLLCACEEVEPGDTGPEEFGSGETGE